MLSWAHPCLLIPPPPLPLYLNGLHSKPGPGRQLCACACVCAGGGGGEEGAAAERLHVEHLHAWHVQQRVCDGPICACPPPHPTPPLYRDLHPKPGAGRQLWGVLCCCRTFAACSAFAAEGVWCAVCVCLQKQALLACFFLLGMGLITFTNATKQAADYFNARYKVCVRAVTLEALCLFLAGLNTNMQE